MTPRIVAAVPLLALAAGALLSMSPPPTASQPPAAPPAAIARLEGPALADDKPRDLPGLHNVVAYHTGYWSGSVPEGDAGFDSLAAMGVKTIISVDGAEPDVEKAKARGIRYIHLPIGYNGFDENRRRELVRATRDAMAEGAVYIHCHHGKHRSAGAAGAVVASLGWLTPDDAVARMKVSGTAPDYKGLYECVAKSTVLDAKVIDAVPADFPEVSHPATFVKAMVEIDVINDRLKLIEQAGWTTPKDHPDLVPVAEAGRMADLFRLVADSDKARVLSHGLASDFAATLRDDSARLTALEDALAAVGAKDRSRLSALFRAVQTSCKDCHAKYRDEATPR